MQTEAPNLLLSIRMYFKLNIILPSTCRELIGQTAAAATPTIWIVKKVLININLERTTSLEILLQR